VEIGIEVRVLASGLLRGGSDRERNWQELTL
jgi:hypothetical protein